MAAREERYRQAAWAYVVYGVVYWLGGLVLATAGFGPRGMERGGRAWFAAGALFVVVIPWLLVRERGWFARWVLSRRDFARVLTLLVVLRAVEVGRIAWRSSALTVAALGVEVPMSVGAWVFCLLTVVTALMLGRAAWGRDA
jgi:hypothetical protein